MRTLAIVTALGSLVSLVACHKGKPTYQAPGAQALEHPYATAGSADRTKLELPQLSGKPPVKTTKPLDAATIEALGKKTFPGFDVDVRAHTDNSIQIHQRTEDHPVLLATITIMPCDADCLPMDLAKWQASPQLKQFLPDELQQAKDTVFTDGTATMFGQPMIYTYQLGQVAGPHGGANFTDAYILRYNDGVNQIRVTAEYKDDGVKTKEIMAKLAPEQDLAKVAMTFMDAYTQAW